MRRGDAAARAAKSKLSSSAACARLGGSECFVKHIHAKHSKVNGGGGD
jgi:hypothetical protein